MTADDRLTEVFERGLREGVNSLSPVDRELFRIQDFIIEYEINGLSGYFYNRLPDLLEIGMAVEAMRNHGLPELSALASEALALFAEYTEPDPPTTWGEILSRYDPSDQLETLGKRIAAIDNYGLSRSLID
jgi:hypothetical protein